ncbi:aspartate racemase [Vagococcus penaei]|uniref:Aspartate racemase n=1 Tax=Vagococcus penaei TaxID=633807 RepID=A0A1Q2D6D6_9ENTE|nr:amino acid racemase [Vagococcus penaei]AQP53940.1 aspartate racemase [Vagococcus penaei]RSU02896.1 aspartate racemase [Vagococcus penaei]
MQQFFTVIGGMGTMATELYIKMLNRKTPATKDQDYFDYILVNYSTIPDRSSYIMNPEKHENPLPYLVEVLEQQSRLNPSFFVLTCNTAHYFFNELEAATDVPILHMPRLAVSRIAEHCEPGVRVGIIGTEGTIKNKIYDPYIEEKGYEVVHPTKAIQEQVSTLIFDKIKAKNELDTTLYFAILDQMFQELACDVVLLGCTELSLVEDLQEYPRGVVIDPQDVLADCTVELATQVRQEG